ncbi:MAG: SDR family oxidoreductase [Anaerolineae bacterium]|nr:SDR family oxidoreductase [Anaerolineae bacterium]
MIESVLITGSNRGIGLALVREYGKRRVPQIFATCRDPESADELQQLAQQGKVQVIPLDITNEDSIAAAAERVQSTAGKLDVLINNAGIYPEHKNSRIFGQLEAEAVGEVVTTNSVSPLIVTQAFAPLLRKGNNPRVVMISSQMGSIDRAGGNSFAYRMSKAAMNMGARVLANTLRSERIIVITTHPGHVATDMGGSHAPVSPEDSARGLVMLIENLKLEQSGQFFDWRGARLPW